MRFARSGAASQLSRVGAFRRVLQGRATVVRPALRVVGSTSCHGDEARMGRPESPWRQRAVLVRTRVRGFPDAGCAGGGGSWR
jgi:hypothetical protein